MSGDRALAKLVWGTPGRLIFLRLKAERHSMKTNCAESKMNEVSLLNRANVFEAGLFSGEFRKRPRAN